MSALREIFAEFTAIFDTSSLEKGAEKVEGLVSAVKAAGKAFAAFKLVETVVEFAQETAKAAREAEFGASRLGMQTDEYQKLSQVAKNYNITTEQLQVASRMLERALSDTGGTMGTFSSRTHFAHDALKNLGIDAHQFRGQKLEQILPVLADGFAKITDPVEQTAIALRLFGHRGLAFLPIMKAGGDALRKQFAAMIPIFEEATITQADRAALAANNLSNNWKNLIFNSFGKAAMGALEKTSDAFAKVVGFLKELSKNSEIGKAVLITLTAALVAAGIAGAAAWWSILWPILAALAAFAAIALVLDDIIVFFEGGQSLIGDWLDNAFGPGTQDKVRKWFEDLKDKVVKAWHQIVDEVDWDHVGMVIGKGFEIATKAVVGLVHAIQWVIDKIDALSKTKAWKFLVDQPTLSDEELHDIVFHGKKKPKAGAPPDALNGDEVAELANRVVNFHGPGTTTTSQGDPLVFGPPSPTPTLGGVNQNFTVVGGDPEVVREAAKRGAQEALDLTWREGLAAHGGAR